MPEKLPNAPFKHNIPCILIFFESAKFKATAAPAE